MPEILVNPYCSVEDVERELRNDESDIADDIIRAINSASRWIDEHMSRDYFFHDHTTAGLTFWQKSPEVIDDTIYLPFTPIITLTSVVVAGETWVLDTDYFLPVDARGRKTKVVSLRGNWPVGNPPDETVVVKGTFGFAQANSATVPTGFPDHIRQACISLAAAWSGHNTKEISSLDGGKESVADKKVPSDIFKILGPKRPRVF